MTSVVVFPQKTQCTYCLSPSITRLAHFTEMHSTRLNTKFVLISILDRRSFDPLQFRKTIKIHGTHFSQNVLKDARTFRPSFELDEFPSAKNQTRKSTALEPPCCFLDAIHTTSMRSQCRRKILNAHVRRGRKPESECLEVSFHFFFLFVRPFRSYSIASQSVGWVLC